MKKQMNDVMGMCERGECKLIFNEILMMQDRHGNVWVSFDGIFWHETNENTFVDQFKEE